MVLCSVTIHGLSIPFFSLGRRVHSVGSRTWSRHASAIPEWATQTKHITRGQDVVINRDPISTMEKGEGAVSIVESKRNLQPSEEGGPDVIEESRFSPTATLAEEESMKEDPPDGTETALEWREGSHKIIEKRGGPGQEVSRPSIVTFTHLSYICTQVEVEVVRDAFDTEQEHSSSFFKGRDGTAMQMARAYLSGLRHGRERIRRDLKEAGEDIEEGIRKVKKQASHIICSPSGENDDKPAVQSNDDREGKVSATCHSHGGSTPPITQHEDHRKRPQSAGANMASEHADVKPSRKILSRRASISGGDSSGHDTPPAHTSREYEDATGDNDRGRSAHTRQNTDQSAHRSVKHRRLESLKFEQASREASPARSVRFADTEGRNGTTTPRSATLQNDQWSQANQISDSPQEDEESTRGRVTFELPPPTR